MTSENLSPTKHDLESALSSLSKDLDTLSNLYQPESHEDSEDRPSADLIVWNELALLDLQKLKGQVDSSYDILVASERASVIFVTAAFIGKESFTDDRCKALANACLDRFIPIDRQTASHVLVDHLKPVFQSTAHPGVHPDTGRVKPNPLSVQEMYDEQPWKTHGVGCWNVLSWVISHIEADSIESLWHLIIPPLLTLIDDYDPPYKIKGVVVTEALLKKATPSLLRRTGIDELLFKALKSALQNFTSDWSPGLLRAATPCYISLVDLVLPDDTMKRFDKLAELVTDTIVPGWLYASSRVEVMIASVDALSLVVQALGIGSARFLKAFISQLTENLFPRELSPVESTLALRVSSARCLLTVMKNARPRIPHWRIRILEAVLRCWVDVVEGPRNGDSAPLKSILLDVFAELLVSSGGLLKKELSTLEGLGPDLFSELIEIQKNQDRSSPQQELFDQRAEQPSQ
ncbi:hypothetical protein BDV93DRAFT_602204 [Ceratobasidium sp. AG-I]|nr:hypothetical protein BDV93DRAFT_602204 [Ceratobasidium sp. AG-I]